jgi:phenylalanine ammonia-lyase
MVHICLSLTRIGKLVFVQFMEIDIPAMNQGLFPGGKVGLNFAFKVRDWSSYGQWNSLLQLCGQGVDIAALSYMGKSNALGGMNIGVGNVSAEMCNKSVKYVLSFVSFPN